MEVIVRHEIEQDARQLRSFSKHSQQVSQSHSGQKYTVGDFAHISHMRYSLYSAGTTSSLCS